MPHILVGGYKSVCYKPRILIVDDDAVSLHLLVKVLSGSGDYDLETASSVAGALNTLSTVPIDLVLSDLQMPGGDGLELYDWLKANEGTVHIPLFFVTASGEDPRFKERRLEDVVMRKPIMVKNLLATVHNHLMYSREARSR